MQPCPERAQITPPPPVAAGVAWDTADAAMAPSTDADTWQMCQAVGLSVGGSDLAADWLDMEEAVPRVKG